MSFGSMQQAAEVMKVTSHRGLIGPTISFAVGTIGAGVLAIPTAFRDCGIYTAIIIIGVAAAFTIVGVNFMAKAIESAQEWNYEDLSELLLGKKSVAVAQIVLVTITMGMVIAYFIVIGDILEPFLPDLARITGMHSIFMGPSGKTCAALTYWTIVILPILCIPSMKYLHYTSSLGVFASLYVTFLIVYRYFVPFEYHGVDLYGGGFAPLLTPTASPGASSTSGHHTGADVLSHQYKQAVHGSHWHNNQHRLHYHQHPLQYVYWSGLWSMGTLIAFPIMMFAFDSLPIVFQLFAILEGEDDRVWQMTKVGIGNVTICSIVFALIGVFGYLSFGANVQDNIISNYDPKRDVLATIAYFSCCFTITMAYAVNLFPARDVILNHFYDYTPSSPKSNKSSPRRSLGGQEEEGSYQDLVDYPPGNNNNSANDSDDEEPVLPYHLHIITVVALSVVCFGISYLIPSIVTVVSICGAVGSSLLCYIYPAAFVLQLHATGIRRCKNIYELSLMWLMLAVGVVAGVLGTGVSLYTAVYPAAADAASRHHH